MAADPAALLAELAELPPSLLALMPRKDGAPRVRDTRWDEKRGGPVWTDPTRDEELMIPVCLRDLIAEFGPMPVVRAYKGAPSRSGILDAAADAPGVTPITWMQLAAGMREAYRLQDRADARRAKEEAAAAQ